MDLVDRYLQAVSHWLPRKQQNDILSELADDLQSEIEDREKRSGHALGDAEVAEVLRHRGHPMLVANRYLPPRYLIGPALFPMYALVLKIVLIAYAVPWVLIKVGLLIVAADRGTLPQLGSELLQILTSLTLAASVAFGVVTLAFLLIERLQAAPRRLTDWDPMKLPRVRTTWVIPRLESTLEVAVSVLVLILLINNLRSNTIFDREGVRVVLSPVWQNFFVAIVLSMACGFTLSAANLARPYWTWLRLGLRLVLDATGAAIFCWLLSVNVLAEFAAPHVSPERAAEIVTAINMTASRMFPLAVMISLLILALSSGSRLIRLALWPGRRIDAATRAST